MIPRLWLDYQRAPPGRQLPGLILLGAGLLAAAGVLYRYQDVSAELEQLEASVTRQRRAAARHPALDAEGITGMARTAAGTAGLAAGREGPAAGYGRERWEMLFAALEAAADESVTLLALRPAAAEVQLGGEAINLAAAFDYVKRLESGAAFASVHLAQSEVVREHPQHPVRFSVIAVWRKAAP